MLSRMARGIVRMHWNEMMWWFDSSFFEKIYWRLFTKEKRRKENWMRIHRVDWSEVFAKMLIYPSIESGKTLFQRLFRMVWRSRPIKIVDWLMENLPKSCDSCEKEMTTTFENLFAFGSTGIVTLIDWVWRELTKEISFNPRSRSVRKQSFRISKCLQVD